MLMVSRRTQFLGQDQQQAEVGAWVAGGHMAVATAGRWAGAARKPRPERWQRYRSHSWPFSLMGKR
eukprot:5856332-Lingulodinium_polyedra.AAC.1